MQQWNLYLFLIENWAGCFLSVVLFWFRLGKTNDPSFKAVNGGASLNLEISGLLPASINGFCYPLPHKPQVSIDRWLTECMRIQCVCEASLGHRNLVQYIGEIYSVASLVILLQRALSLFTSAGSDPVDQAAHTHLVMGSAETQGWCKKTLKVTAVNSLLYPGWSSVTP